MTIKRYHSRDTNRGYGHEHYEAETGNWVKWESIVNELKEHYCITSYGFEGLDTYLACGKCLICQVHEYVNQRKGNNGRH